jgi:hypothetical protein
MAVLILTADEEVAVSVAFVDNYGNPAVTDGPPAWTVSDTSILSVVSATDGNSALVSTLGPVGLAQVSVGADADLGTGTTNVVGLINIQVVSGLAVSAVLTSATPTQKVSPPTP